MLVYLRFGNNNPNDPFYIEVDLPTLLLSMGVACHHLFLELLSLKFESKAIEASKLSYFVVCFNARQGWIPFGKYFQPPTEETKKVFSSSKAIDKGQRKNKEK